MIPATMSRRVRGSLAFLLVLSVSALLGGACAKRTPPPAAAWKTLGPVNIEWITSMDVGVNTYILWVRPGGACWIVDPGLPPYPERILAYVRRHNLSPAAVLLTHGHADHLYGLAEILAAYPKLPVYLAVEENN